jgi:hypothetical protein
LEAKPLISLPVDAIINKEGKLERIYHWANKMWKLGGSRHMKTGRQAEISLRKRQAGTSWNVSPKPEPERQNLPGFMQTQTGM